MARRRRRSLHHMRNFILASLGLVLVIGIFYNIDKIANWVDQSSNQEDVIEEQVIELPIETSETDVIPSFKSPEEIQLSDSVEDAKNAYENAGYHVKVFTNYVPNAKSGITKIVKDDPIVIYHEAERTSELLVELQEKLKIAGFYTIRDGGYGPSFVSQLVAFKLEVLGDSSNAITSDVIQALDDVNAEKIVKDPVDLLLVVNSDNNLLSDYVPDHLVSFSLDENSSVMIREEMKDALTDLLQAAKNDGIDLTVLEGYRDYAKQESVFNKALRRSNFETAKASESLPGQSEHQIGLAIDFADGKSDYVYVDSFGQTPEYEWLVNNCMRFGFILRYPEGKSDLTQTGFRPWHFRYIGDVHEATRLMNENKVLEER